MKDIKAFAESSLLAYCHLVNKEFITNWHHELIAKHLEETLHKPKRLIFNMPPRHGKSYLVSQHFPTWFLGRQPSKNVILACYGQSLATDSGRAVRNLMQTDTYKSLFDTRLSKDSTSKTTFDTTEHGSYFAVGKGGPITGRGGDIIIIDDLLKSDQEARSELHRSNIRSWWKETLYTRLMPGGSIIIVNTRWHQDDLTGWLLKNSDQNWEHISLPAISNIEGQDVALWDSQYPIEILKDIKKEIGSHAFDTEYQQNPSDPEGQLVKKTGLREYDKLPIVFQDYIISFDLAFKGNSTSDFVVGQCWGKNKANYYLIDQIRGRWDFTQTLKQFQAFCDKHDYVTRKVVEDAANASALHSVIKDHIPGVILWKPNTDKIGRLNSVTPLFEAGNIHVPSSNTYDWVDEMKQEWFSFPNGKNDDTVDAMTQALLNLENVSKSFVIAYS